METGRSDDLADQATSVGALAEPARRSLSQYVTAQPDPVRREQAAAAIDFSLHSVQFHLDPLVEKGKRRRFHRSCPPMSSSQLVAGQSARPWTR